MLIPQENECSAYADPFWKDILTDRDYDHPDLFGLTEGTPGNIHRFHEICKKVNKEYDRMEFVTKTCPGGSRAFLGFGEAFTKYAVTLDDTMEQTIREYFAHTPYAYRGWAIFARTCDAVRKRTNAPIYWGRDYTTLSRAWVQITLSGERAFMFLHHYWSVEKTVANYLENVLQEAV